MSSSSGTNASLEGAGVNVEADVVLADLERPLDGAGVEAATVRALGAAGELVEGVFWKKPKRVFCPAEDDDFFRAGVLAGVEATFLGILSECTNVYGLYRGLKKVDGVLAVNTGR